jgi:Raf kinase inhibitor-like YbhB/YbcL family protein
VHAGEHKLASQKLELGNLTSLVVRSDAFVNANPLPLSATADGIGAPPHLEWLGVPPSARSVALIVEDPDAPFPRPFVHWLLYDLEPTVSVLDGIGFVGREGKNSLMKIGFTPAAPPPGHGAHRYHFQLFALDKKLDLEPGAGRSALIEAMRGHVVAWGELVGTYERR